MRPSIKDNVGPGLGLVLRYGVRVTVETKGVTVETKGQLVLSMVRVRG